MPFPLPNEILADAHARVSRAEAEAKAKEQQLDLMTEMLRAAEEELRLRSDQQGITQEMLKATEAELVRKDGQVLRLQPPAAPVLLPPTLCCSRAAAAPADNTNAAIGRGRDQRTRRGDHPAEEGGGDCTRASQARWCRPRHLPF